MRPSRRRSGKAAHRFQNVVVTLESPDPVHERSHARGNRVACPAVVLAYSRHVIPALDSKPLRGIVELAAERDDQGGALEVSLQNGAWSESIHFDAVSSETRHDS